MRIEQKTAIKISIIEKTDHSVKVQADGGDGFGAFCYACRKTNIMSGLDADFGKNGENNTFDNLKPGETYYIFAYRKGDDEFFYSQIKSLKVTMPKIINSDQPTQIRR